jgi:hypothetical protein
VATGGSRPVIEAVIRARDEASAVFAQATRKMAEDGTKLEQAFTSTARGAGSAADLIGGAFAKFGPIVAVAATVGAEALGAYMQSVEEATKQQVAFNEALRGFSATPFVAELKKANREIEEHAERSKSVVGTLINLWQDARIRPPGDTPEERRDTNAREAAIRQQLEGEQRLRQSMAQAAAIEERRLETERRAALEQGNTAAADAAARQVEEVAARRMQAQRDALNAERRMRESTYQELGQQVPAAVSADLEQRAANLEAQADQQRLERQRRNAEQVQRYDEQATQRREQQNLRILESERALEQARLQAATRLELAAAQRTGNIEQAFAVQLRGIAAVRDAELRAIAEAADARARMARGPGREDEVLAIRRQEQAQVQQTNLRAATEVLQAQERAVQDRDRRARELEAAQADVEGIRRERFHRFTLPDLERSERELQRYQLANPQADTTEMERNLFYARQAANEQLEAERQRDREALDTREQKAETKVAELSKGFAEANTNAAALTEKVKELGAALKDLQVSPGFAQKLSQDLADTLQFLSARQP